MPSHSAFKARFGILAVRPAFAAVGMVSLLLSFAFIGQADGHQLNASAIHPSMLFTNFASSWFTNSESPETVSDGMDLAGNVTNRVWMQGTNFVHTQTL